MGLLARLSSNFAARPSQPRRTRRASTSGALVQPLESRVLFHLEVTSPVADVSATQNQSATNINLGTSFDNETFTGTLVRLATNRGNIDLEMFDVAISGRSAAPLSVANFLDHVNDGDYNGTFFHRLISGFVLQGGGFKTDKTDISPPGTPTVQNEFNADRSNVAGTVAYAKLGGDPDSATTEFFINLDDNSGTAPNGLDFQNGGFTVFGQVVNNTMTTVNDIADQPTVDEDTSTPFNLYNDVPVVSAAPDDQFPAVNNLISLTTASVIPEISYQVSSDNTALVNPSVSNNTLTLNYGANQTGTATITVTATDFTGATVQDTFDVTVNAVASNELDVVIGDGGAKALIFTDADGTTGTVTLKGGGSATIHVTGSGLTQETSSKGVTVEGDAVIESVTATGTDDGSTLTFKTKGGDRRISVAGLTSDGAFKNVAGKTVDMIGDVNIAGTVSKLDLRSMTGIGVSLGGASDSDTQPSITVASAITASDITSGAPIKSLKVTDVVGGTAADTAITAPSIAKLTVAGDFDQGLELSGSLTSASIRGDASGPDWTIGGNVGKFTANATSAAWSATIAGDVTSFTTKDDFAGNVTAASVRTMKVGGDMTGDLTLTEAFDEDSPALNKLTVTGAIQGVNIRSTNSLRSITARNVDDSTIYAGLTVPDGGVLPDDANDFANNAEIVSLSLKGRTDSFSNSNISAARLGKINLGEVTTNNAGVPFGVAADVITSLSGRVTGGDSFKIANLDEPTDAVTRLTALGVNFGDFDVAIFNLPA